MKVYNNTNNKASYDQKALVPNVSLAQAMASYLIDVSGNIWPFATCPGDNFLQLVRQHVPEGKSHVLDAELQVLCLDDEFSKWFVLDLLSSKRIRASIPLYGSADAANAAAQRAREE